MFDQTFVNAQEHARNPWSLALSLTVQTAAIGLLLLIPLLHPEGPLMRIDPPPIVYRPTPIVRPVPVRQTVVRSAPRSLISALLAPRTVPTSIAKIVDVPEAAPGVPDSLAAVPGGIPADFISRLPERIASVPAPKPAPVRADPPPPPTAPLRVSTTVQSALLIFGPKPLYPPLARAARVQGTVRLTAIIGTDGAIRNLTLISGPPLLVRASLDAVQQWRYKPTLLNGSPVEVVTEVDVNFTLGQ